MRSTTLKHLPLALLASFAVQAAGLDCPPDHGGDALTDWREVLIKEVTENRAQEVLDAVARCYPVEIPACYKDLKEHAEKVAQPWNRGPSSFQENELTVKSPSDLPEVLRGSEGSVKIPDNIEDIVKRDGGQSWRMAYYKTRGTGGFNRPPNLFIMAYSNDKYDVVLQTSPHPDQREDGKNPMPNGPATHHQDTLTVITRDKTKNPPVGQLRMLFKKPGTSNEFVWDNETKISSCTGCHTVPFRPISPIGYKELNGEMRMGPEQEAMVDSVNEILRQPISWGTTQFNGKEYALGPVKSSQPTGWTPPNSPTRQKKFLKECLDREKIITTSGFGGYSSKFVMSKKARKKINTDKLANAMNCTECHNGVSRGALHEEFSNSEIRFKILVDRSMPPGMELSIAERMALVSCLEAEKFQVRDQWFQSGVWMKKASCHGPQFKNPPVKQIGGAKIKETKVNQK